MTNMTYANGLICEMWEWITSQSDFLIPEYLQVERWKIFHMAQEAGIELELEEGWRRDAERIYEDTGAYPWED